MADTSSPEPEVLGNCVRCLEQHGVSAHYFIARNGEVWSLVPPGERAWHAGASRMPAPDNRERVNDFSVGIELIALPDTGFVEVQYRALIELIGELCVDYPIRAIVGHSDIAVPPGRKVDPGPTFDWTRVDGVQAFFPHLVVHGRR